MQDVWEVLDEDLKESEIAYPPEEKAAKEKVSLSLSDDVNSEAGREVERNEELRRGWQQSAVPCAAGSHGGAGLLQHLAQGPQAQPQSVLNAKEAAAQNNVQWSLFIERKTMEQFFYTETMTVMNADADFRSLLKPSALLRYVEQISTDHARAFGMDDQSSKNAV